MSLSELAAYRAGSLLTKEGIAADHALPYWYVMAKTPKTRLTRDAWIAKGFDVLAEEGPEALKAEPLARKLDTTKGSFYWHFKDVPDFHAALLDTWEARAEPPEEEDGPPVAQLRALAAWLGAPDRQDVALRAWAKADETVERVDGARMDRVAELLRESGVSNPEMAQILYAASVGMRSLHGGEAATGPEAMESLVDLMMALR